MTEEVKVQEFAVRPCKAAGLGGPVSVWELLKAGDPAESGALFRTKAEALVFAKQVAQGLGGLESPAVLVEYGRDGRELKRTHFQRKRA